MFSDSEICYVENQSDVDKQKTSLVSVVQEFNKDSKTLGFIYKLKQSSLWTEYFCDANQTYSIKSHSDFLGWGEMFTLLFMYVGTRFLSLITLDELVLQSVLGKNIRRHQPFDYDESYNLSIDDPRPVSEQAIQNVLAHWIHKFIVDSFNELVLSGTKHAHTITYKDPENILAPTLVNHLEECYKQKPKPRDKFLQTKIGEFKYMVEEEKIGDDIRSYIAIPPPEHDKEYHDKFEQYFKLSLQACPYVIQERIKCASKYPDQNLAKKYAKTFNHY